MPPTASSLSCGMKSLEMNWSSAHAPFLHLALRQKLEMAMVFLEPFNLCISFLKEAWVQWMVTKTLTFILAA